MIALGSFVKGALSNAKASRPYAPSMKRIGAFEGRMGRVAWLRPQAVSRLFVDRKLISIKAQGLLLGRVADGMSVLTHTGTLRSQEWKADQAMPVIVADGEVRVDYEAESGEHGYRGFMHWPEFANPIYYAGLFVEPGLTPAEVGNRNVSSELYQMFLQGAELYAGEVDRNMTAMTDDDIQVFLSTAYHLRHIPDVKTLVRLVTQINFIDRSEIQFDDLFNAKKQILNLAYERGKVRDLKQGLLDINERTYLRIQQQYENEQDLLESVYLSLVVPLLGSDFNTEGVEL